MFLVRWFFKLVFVSVAAMLGNFVGYQMREQMLGEAGPDLRFYQRNDEGEVTIAVNPILTNFLPTLLIGMVARPGILMAFIAGAAIGAVVGDKYEDRFYALLGVK